MKRLITSNNTQDIKKILDRIDNSMNDLNETYYLLLNNLNELFKTYPDVYDEINQIVKLPTKDDIQDIVDMKNNFEDIRSHFEDDSYLENFDEKL